MGYDGSDGYGYSKRPRTDDRERGMERDRRDRVDYDRGRDDRGRDYDRRDRYGDREQLRDRDGDRHRERERERESDRYRDRERDYRDRDRGQPPDRMRGDRGDRGGRDDRDSGRDGWRGGRHAGGGASDVDHRALEKEKEKEREEAAAKKKAEEEEYQKRVLEQAQELEENDEDAEERRIEERRRRRAEIAARHQQKAPVSNGAAAEAPHKVEASSEISAVSSAHQANQANASGSDVADAAADPASEPSAAAPAAMSVGAPDVAMEEAGEQGEGEGEEEPKFERVSSMELSGEAKQKENELRKYLLEQRRQMETGSKPAAPASAPVAPTEDEGAEKKAGADEFDMFNDEVKEPEAAIEAIDEAAAMDRGDNYDDKEGYYAHRVGDVLNDRFKVLGAYGKGVFSTVLRCLDMKSSTGNEVAIKVQRSNEMMRRAGEKEVMYLKMLAENDVENKKHCIQYLGSFDHEDHLCMVFEAMHQNLRMALRQHGHKRGIQMDAVRIYARQLFVALRYMERLNIMHADLKPDNIVVNDKYNLLKVCDFGSASSGDDNEITPYLVSRFYRAPEIMMGLTYGCAIDMWAAGVTLFELYTGKIMFQGNSNNQMLKLMQEVKGKMPHKLIRKGFFQELHFDPDYDFLYKEKDKVSGREIIRCIKFEQRPTPGRDLKSLLMPTKLVESEKRKVDMLADLLEKVLALDPSKRMKPADALKHPFCDLSRK